MKIKYRVHGGFLKCWKTIEDIVIRRATEKGFSGDYRWKRIVVVGYSHGAALAALCHEAVWFHREDLRAEGLTGIGFDGPRIYGGWRVKKELRERWAHFTMFRNGSDIVTHLPPICFFFRHVGELYPMGKKNIFKCVKHHYPEEIRKSLGEIENERFKEL